MTDEIKRGPTPPHMAGEAGKVDPDSVGRIEQPKPVKTAAAPAKQEAATAAKPEKRLHPILSNEEVHAARAKARKKIEDEQKAFALAAIEKEELTRLRTEEFVTVGGVEDELVHITIDLPDFGDCLKTNMKPYWHGQTYLVTRDVARDLAWRMQSMWQHQLLQIDGKKLRDTYYRNTALNLGMRETHVSGTGVVTNAPEMRH
jgi:hypothetical protein